jgi:CRISPR/Cas system-associated endonuclease Cas1
MLRPLKVTVPSRIVFIEDDGVVLATYGRALVVRGQGIRLTELPANTRVVVLSGYGASITVAAMHACVSKHVEVLITSPRYGVMAMFVPSPVINASRVGLAIRQKQFRAVGDPARSLKVARAIVGEKIKAERHARATERVFAAQLRKAGTTDDVRHVEAKAAQVWWEQWVEFRISFKGPGVPAEWGLWPGRYIGRRQGRLGELAAQFTARNAVHTLQALQNYAVGIAAGRMTRVIAAVGLDPAFGFLVWDCVELLRPGLVKVVFEYAGRKVFKKGDFAVSTEGVVRLGGI